MDEIIEIAMELGKIKGCEDVAADALNALPCNLWAAIVLDYWTKECFRVLYDLDNAVEEYHELRRQ